jgi:hypothetical protein
VQEFDHVWFWKPNGFQRVRVMSEQDVEAICDAIRSMRDERDALRERLTNLKVRRQAGYSELADVLRKALSGAVGWREEARRALGEYKLITCRFCGALFESGGKRRKSCGRC